MATTDHTYKSWMAVGLVAAALTVSACGKKDDSPIQTEPVVDAQTAVEQEATGVATANDTDDVAVARADDVVVMTDEEVISGDVAVARADDAEVLDGTESVEHVSTY